MNSEPGKGALRVNLRQQLPFHMQVSLCCEPGELLALVGPSGSGKTTVLRTIAGLHRAESGTVHCAEQIWFDSSQGIHARTQQRKIGFVFQDYALFPHKSVLENVQLAAAGATNIERRQMAMQWLQRTNMQGLHDRKPASLSGGQKQRVALARALAREPTALLMDEPFSAVDQQTRRKLYRELAQLRHELNLPILLVTHDIHEVQQLADNLCIIHRGVSLQQGRVDQVINQPDNKIIARLVGHQNIFAATVASHDAHHTHYKLGDKVFLTGRASPNLTIGSNLHLLIAPTAITVIDYKAQQTKEQPQVNRMDGKVSGAVQLGDELSLRLHLDCVPKSLRFRIPRHIARNFDIGLGSRVSVCIRRDGLHTMQEQRHA